MNHIKVLTTGQTYKIQTDIELVPGQEVLVEAEQIFEPALVLCMKCPKREQENFPETTFVRVMTPEDYEKKRKLKEEAKKFVTEAQTKVLRHMLEMKIVDSDISFDEKKITFYFTSEGRVDFRALVSDMVGSFRKIIRLQQVGPREETRLMGGIGRCGQELCCHRFIKDLDGLASEMSQIAESGGSKLSKMTGCCGRLMCCLSYEDASTKIVTKDTKQEVSKEVKK